MSTTRKKDSYNQSLYNFIKDMYVVCPSCSKKALVKTNGLSYPDRDEEIIKLICISCGYNKRFKDVPETILHATTRKIIWGRYIQIGGAIDPYFKLPLWLTISCCDEILWAYNDEHLNFIQTHVEAKLRERNTAETANKSLGSRLPKWMTSKKNRESILKSIAHLKNKY